MRRVRTKDTMPELRVRRALHQRGFLDSDSTDRTYQALQILCSHDLGHAFLFMDAFGTATTTV